MFVVASAAKPVGRRGRGRRVAGVPARSACMTRHRAALRTAGSRHAGMRGCVAVLVLTTLVWGYDQSLGPIEQHAPRRTVRRRAGAHVGRLACASGRTASRARSSWPRIPLVTANFLHAGFMHLAMNMVFFWIFGNALSEAAGRVAFLALYLLGGIDRGARLRAHEPGLGDPDGRARRGRSRRSRGRTSPSRTGGSCPTRTSGRWMGRSRRGSSRSWRSSTSSSIARPFSAQVARHDGLRRPCRRLPRRGALLAMVVATV